MARSFSLRDLIAKLRVVYDKGSGKQAEDEVKGSLGRVEGVVKKVGAAIASAFAVTAIIRFAQVSVQAAIEAERVWNRLSGTLASVNVRYEEQERRIRAAAAAMREAAGIGDDDFAATLARLVSLTGDFNLSLSNMGLVADVAARFFGGDLAPAVDLVGRALNGQLRSLREVGIVTKDLNEGLRILRERSAGAAENELKSIDGRLRQMKDAAGEVREEMGFLIFRIFGGDDTERAINRFRLGLDGIADRLARIGRRRAFWREQAEETAQSEFEATDPTAGIAQLDPVFGIATPVTQADRDAAAARAAETRARRMMRDAQERARRFNREQELTGFRETETMGIVDFDFHIPPPDTSIVDQWESSLNRIGDVAFSVTQGMQGAFHDTFALILSGSANAGEVFEEMMRGMAAAVIGGVAEYASVKSGEQIAEGIADLAAGTWPPNPAAWAAAAQHFKSAGLWALLAGASGAGAGALAGGGGGGAIPSGTSDIGGRLADSNVPKTEINVFVDGFDSTNGRHVRKLTDGMLEAARTDSRINLQEWKRR